MMDRKTRPESAGTYTPASKREKSIRQPDKETTVHSRKIARSASWKQTDSVHRNRKNRIDKNQDRKSRNLNNRDRQNRDISNRDRKNGVRKKKKRGCLPPFLFLLLLILLLYAGVSVTLGAALKKIEAYHPDPEQIIINDDVHASDKNIGRYQNIALFGVDDQDNKIRNKGSRTDCIIVASINKRSKKVKLMSIYRDTYVSINGQYDKINAAYSYGGPELAISTINRNLDLDITDFATVNFKALADAVDIVGGIPLTVQSEKERKNLNDYIRNMNHINGGDSPTFDKPKDYPFTKVFDGNQAVAYSRIRYMAGGDHARASHQRLVVEGLMAAVKRKPWKLGKLINTVLPQCVTSLSTSEMKRLCRWLPFYKIEDSQAYPFDSEDERYNGIYYGFPLTARNNVIKAHEYLFGTKDYEPTEEMGKISVKIEAVTDAIGLYPR